MIDTVLRNLVINAIKYCFKGGNIDISTYNDQKNKIIVKVIDDGIGIPKEDLPKLFRIDQKVQTTGTSDEKGTGLGLAISQQFIKMMQGERSATSKLV